MSSISCEQKPISAIFVSAFLSRSLKTATEQLMFLLRDARGATRNDEVVTHPRFVEGVVLQAKQAAPLAGLHRGGCGRGQQAW